jgi:hypothetical protein
LLKQAAAKIPVDPASNSPVRAMQLIKGFIAKRSFPQPRRWLLTSHAVVEIPLDLRIFIPEMLWWISGAVQGLMSFWLLTRLGNKAE